MDLEIFVFHTFILALDHVDILCRRLDWLGKGRHVITLYFLDNFVSFIFQTEKHSIVFTRPKRAVGLVNH